MERVCAGCLDPSRTLCSGLPAVFEEGGFPLRKTVGLLIAMVALVGVVGAALADSPSPRNGRILGEVLSAHQNAAGSLGAGQLKYHGGPVMHTNKVYAIYW